MVRTTVALVGALSFTEDGLQGLGDVDLDRPTCCPPWTVREVLNHTTATVHKFAAFAAAETDAPTTPHGDLLGNCPGSAFAIEAASARRAWAHVDLGRTCRLPFGTFTAEQAAGICLFDLLAHYSDMALAIDATISGPTEALAPRRRLDPRGVAPPGRAER